MFNITIQHFLNDNYYKAILKGNNVTLEFTEEMAVLRLYKYIFDATEEYELTNENTIIQYQTIEKGKGVTNTKDLALNDFFNGQ